MRREKRPYQILTFSTTTGAMAMEKFCLDHGVPGRLIPVPPQITAGCGLAWRMTVEEYEKYHFCLEKQSITLEQCVMLCL